MLCCEVMKTGMVATPYVRIGGGLLTPFLKDVTKSYILLERIYVGTMFGLPLMFAIGLWIYISFSSEHLGDNGMVEEEPLLGYENGIHMRTLLVG